MRTRCLSIHRGYRCRHSGACCQAGWTIDVEPHIVEALTSGRVIPLSSSPGSLVRRTDDIPGMSLARSPDGWCGFRNDSRCSLQEAAGEAMLPSACRHFPRIVLRDARGTLLTLSHFCPTAAALLFDDQPIAIVDIGPPLAPGEPIEGLDARDALPPLVRPGLLSDIDGYAAWEEAVVREFAGPQCVRRALERIAGATESVRCWTPAQGTMANGVEAAFAEPRRRATGGGLSRGFDIVREITGPHPLLDMERGFVESWTSLEATAGEVLRRPVANYMAACAFGNWTAYRGQGLRTVVAWLHACYDVLRLQLVRQTREAGTVNRDVLIEAFRMSDLILVHNVPSLEFGRAATIFEQERTHASVSP